MTRRAALVPLDGGLPVAVDAMGGDYAPRELVRGAALAAITLGVPVALVGRRTEVERELADLEPSLALARDRLELVEASEVVAMDEHPAQAVRAKRDASIVVACRLVAEGRARAAVSAGNSGAVLAAALFVVQRVPGVARPAIGAVLPTSEGPCFLLDVGANADCRPEWLRQFAVVGSVYANTMLAVPAPTVGLLSNGEEPGKGNELVRQATPLLENAPIRFVGNVEGKDLVAGRADVVVCDGFSGNVALKTAEGVAEFLFGSLRSAAQASWRGRVGGALLRPALRPLRERLDWRRTGGALLLGVAGEVVVAHGRSDAVAVMNAIRLAGDAAARRLHQLIAEQLGRLVPNATADSPDEVPAAP